MHVAAVTGTNGKTSTAEFVRQILCHAGLNARSHGTLGLVGPDGVDPEPALGVGPNAMPAFLGDQAARGTDVLVFEAFSSALANGLLARVRVDVAAFTNLDADHLDHHGSMGAYFAAKRVLFERVLRRRGTAVLNSASPWSRKLAGVCRQRGCRITWYGPACDGAAVAGRPPRKGPHGARGSIMEADGVGDGSVELQGGRTIRLTANGRVHDAPVPEWPRPMLENLTAALAMCLALRLDGARALSTVPDLITPPGRYERIGEHHGAAVFVDYAHTPAALELLLSEMRYCTRRRLVLVFGCGGDRDASKRELMGRVARRGADLVFVTDDNPRDEEPAAIRRAVRAGCPDAIDYPGRPDAICAALDRLRPDDTLVVAGRGHETRQQVGGESRPFSDREFIRAVLAGRIPEHRGPCEGYT